MEKLYRLFSLLKQTLRCQFAWTTEMAVTGVSAIDAVIPEFWGEGIVEDGNRESFWGSLSGKEGSRMPIIDKTGPLKAKGDQLTIQTIAQLMGTGVTGENVLKGNEEALKVGTFTLTADIVRHAVAVSKKSTKQANFEEVQKTRALLKEWMTRKLDNDVFTSIKDSSAVSTLFANGKTAETSLTTGDNFGPADIGLLRMALIRQGALPLQVVKSNGRTIPIYGLVYGEMEEYYLDQNTVFSQSIREAYQRFRDGSNHPLFHGAVGMYRNMLLYPYYSVLPLPQGTPLRPETTVFATLTTTATTLSVGGATESTGVTPDYTAFFASSGSLQIADEIISYTGKTNNTFTGLTRNEASTTAVQHVPNALVTQRNVSVVMGFGSQAVCRAFPSAVEPIGEKDDYGSQIGLGIEAYYGEKVFVDARRAKAPNVVMLKCFSDNPGTV